MPLVSPFERMAKEEGIKERIDRDKELIIRLIQRKLGVINEDLQREVKVLNIEDLEILAEDLFDMDSIEDLQQWLSNF